MPIEHDEDGEIMENDEVISLLKENLQLLLDQVDYTAGACRATAMVGAVLPMQVLEKVKADLKKTEGA